MSVTTPSVTAASATRVKEGKVEIESLHTYDYLWNQ